MKTTWTKGLDAEKTKIISTEFNESKVLRRRLTEILEEKIRVKRTESIAKDGYEKPNWPYFQADTVGYERAMTEIISILSD